MINNKNSGIFFEGELDELTKTVEKIVIENPISVLNIISIIRLSGQLSQFGIRVDEFLANILKVLSTKLRILKRDE